MNHNGWDHGLKVTGDRAALVGHAGAILLRKAADQSGLTGWLGAALQKAGMSPVLDRGIVLVSAAAAIALGATSMSDIAVLAQLAPALGAAPSGPVVRRLPGYTGTIVRDGYKGYEHLTGALRAWCGAHGLRDLAGLYRFDPDGQVWPRSMADLLIDANATAAAARAAGQASLSDAGLARIRCWYRGAVAKGLAGNTGKTSQIAKDALTLARRFRDHQDMILRFAADLAVGFTSNQGRTRHPPGQGPAAHLRRDLAHPARPGRLRDRPVLPVHHRQMGYRRPRRPHPALHQRPLAPARTRTP